ncbi:hypothetical protein [Enterovibrio calviensis]|nr:hypothetical protein [Enterovibrio calviensis]
MSIKVINVMLHHCGRFSKCIEGKGLKQSVAVWQEPGIATLGI